MSATKSGFPPGASAKDVAVFLVGRAMGLPIGDYFVDIGTLENYYSAQVDYAAASADSGN